MYIPSAIIQEQTNIYEPYFFQVQKWEVCNSSVFYLQVFLEKESKIVTVSISEQDLLEVGY